MISICTPTFEQYGHGVKHLTLLLDSIKKQTCTHPFEVVISDNSKNDDIKKLCKKYAQLPIKYIRNLEAIGISHNTNNAIDNASFDMIKIMYMDDVFIHTDALNLFVKSLQTCKWVVCKTKGINNNGHQYKSHTPKWNHDIIKGSNTMGMPSIMAFKKHKFRFDPNLKTLLDCEYMWLLWENFGPAELIDEFLVGLRYHNNSTSNKQGNLSIKEYEYLKTKYKQLK
jgi:glycosyltransferase involved in cell wall biosynthesis